jgi:acyl-CoA synthetase (AMP-forming)/AMP-acid ligase II
MAGSTIGQLVDRMGQLGDRIALKGEDATYTFAGLKRSVEEFSAAAWRAGLRSGDTAAIWAPNSSRWVVAALALGRIGCVLVPINTRFRGEEAQFILRRVKARILLTTEGFLSTDYMELLRRSTAGRSGSGGLVPGLPNLEKAVIMDADSSRADGWETFQQGLAPQDFASAQRACDLTRPSNPLDLMFTSGTTGFPKGVPMTHDQAISTYQTWADMVGVRSGDTYLISNPFFHNFGYKAGWLVSLLAGATAIPMPVFEETRVLETIAQSQVTVYPAPPSAYQMLLAHPGRRDYDCSSLRVAFTGAAYVPETLVGRMYEDLSFERVHVGWGLTEACGIGTMTHADDPISTVVSTVGRPFPGLEIRLVDDHDMDAPMGDAGELLIRGPSVMSGYWNDEEATKEAFVPGGWLRTGDVGTRDSAGNLRIVGRKKEMFIVGGFNVYPAEVEGAILRHPKVSQAAVLGVPDARLGEVGCAFVVPESDDELTDGEVSAWCRERLANFKVPRQIVVVNELPLNATGKVDKPALLQTMPSVAGT